MGRRPLVNFAGFSKEKETNKPKLMGAKIWDKLIERDENFGGTSVLMTGTPGCGKTSLLLQILERVFKQHAKNELLLMREPWGKPIQVLNIGLPTKFLVEASLPLRMCKMQDSGKPIPTLDLEVEIFEDFNDLPHRLELGKVNVVYFHNRISWFKLFRWTMEDEDSWVSVFVDEQEDLFPMNSKQNLWHMIGVFCDNLKSMRKCKVNFYGNSQSVADTDYRLRPKIQTFVYMPGSVAPDECILSKYACWNLEKGSAWLVHYNSEFGLIEFDAVTPKKPQYKAQCKHDWDRMPDE